MKIELENLRKIFNPLLPQTEFELLLEIAKDNLRLQSEVKALKEMTGKICEIISDTVEVGADD